LVEDSYESPVLSRIYERFLSFGKREIIVIACYYVLAFLRCQGQRFDFAVQNYNKKMTYANKWGFFLDFPEDPERCANLEAG
jgi:hypothetical protein